MVVTDIFKIGEFSKLTQVSVRMLRHYDETGLLKPACVDRLTGYRLYSLDQIAVINKIVFLRDTGFNVIEIAQALKKWDTDNMIELLYDKRSHIEASISYEKSQLEKIQNAISFIDSGKKDVNFNVTVKSVPSRNVVSLRRILPSHIDEVGLWAELIGYAKESKLKLTAEYDFALYHDEEYKDTDVDVEVSLSVDGVGESKEGFIHKSTEAAQTMACIMVYGQYENITEAYLSFAKWLSSHKVYLMKNEPFRRVCHKGSWNEADSAKYLTEIQIPIIEKQA